MWGTMLLNSDDLLAAQETFQAARMQARKLLQYKLMVAAILYKLTVVNLTLGFMERAK
jgi:hypothetical protein